MRGQSGLVQISAGAPGISLGVGFFNSEKMTFLEISDMHLAVFIIFSQYLVRKQSKGQLAALI